jgi:hypothetical protein
MSSGEASAGVGPLGLRHLNLGTLDWGHASRLSKIDHSPDKGSSGSKKERFIRTRVIVSSLKINKVH